MFRPMRRKMQALSLKQCIFILKNASSGVLALSGDNEYPYAVPISFVYDETKIYFHCAKSGHKIDAIKRNKKASFCIIDKDEVVPLKYTTHYRSVIVFGTIKILDSDKDKYEAIEKLAVKYAPLDSKDNRDKAIADEWDPLCILEMQIEHISGKAAKELKGI